MEDIRMETYHYEPRVKPVEKKGIKRVAAYCRVSTMEEEQELSFNTQRSYYEELISKAPDMELVGIYGDQGFSGLDAKKRKEFQRMIADCEADKVDLVLVKSISRFSRNSVECQEYLDRLKAHGVTVMFERENLRSDDQKMSMALAIYSALAQNESCSRSQNIRWARQRRAEMGDPICHPCYGYRSVKEKDGKKTRWEIVEDEARRVRMVFDLAYSGFALKEIVDRMNDYEREEKTDFIWRIGRAENILSREAYKGDILTDKRVTLDYLTKKAVKNTGQIDQFYIEDHHPAIVDDEIFDAVQEYIECGALRGTNVRIRNTWFAKHPDWLERRMKIEEEMSA